MLNKEVLYSLADISIIPCVTTDIISRKECYPYQPDLEGNMESSLLPIIVSPMSCNWTKGISDARIYRENKINVVVPRTVDLNTRLHSMETIMTAFSLKEAEQILKDEEWTKDVERLNVCIDMANGHMTHQIELGKKLKEKFGERLKLMGGNIANPKTYLEYDKTGFDYVRSGIGGGSACLTSTQTGTHYSMGSLLDEISKIKGKTKVIADGGISGYSDAIKCLALGADYVMMGRVFTKASLHGEKIGSAVSYYGMSTKIAQKEMGNTKLKTSEGRSVILNKEYTLEGWTENFTDYLRSAMSYTGAHDLVDFRTGTTCQVISPNSSYAINNK